LKEKNIPYITHLHSAVSEDEARVRFAQEISERLFSVFALCVYSEGRSQGESWEEAQKYIHNIDKILGGNLDNVLSPEEKEFLSVKEPNQQSIAKFGWRYECCYVLMWALGLIEELAYPSDLCDVSSMAKLLFDTKNMKSFLESIKVRSHEKILDAADLILRYNWACVDARVKGKESPAGLNGEVVVEWHYAFNWLIGANQNADWDDIQTNT
jgi:hypothetical protein